MALGLSPQDLNHVLSEVGRAFVWGSAAAGTTAVAAAPSGPIDPLVTGVVFLITFDASLVDSIITDLDNGCLGISCGPTSENDLLNDGDLVQVGLDDYATADSSTNSDGSTDPSGGADDSGDLGGPGGCDDSTNCSGDVAPSSHRTGSNGNGSNRKNQ
jgi:hypothetical protein